MMGSDLELGDSTNPKVESESFVDGSSSENRVDSASIHVTGPSDSSTVVQGVENVVAEGSLDSVSAEGNVSDVNNRGAGDSSKLGVSESDNKDVSSDRNHGSVKRTKNEQKKRQRRKETKSKESTSPAYDSMLSMFDDFAANGSVATEVRLSMEGSGLGSPGHGYEVGDMVWGKVKSHPWWPGHVFSEEFATTSVRRSKREGLLLVAFFGDSSYGWFDPSELMPFESNFAEKSRQTNSKTFVKAVEEAMDELSRRSALGLSCMCGSKQNFRKTDVKGYYAVDIADYEPGAVYSIDAIEKARASFHPSSALDFIRQQALEPNSEHPGIDLIKNKARVVSYRRAVYEEFDDTYAQAFGHQLDRPSPGVKAPLSGRQVFADTSGKGKNPAKPNKSKENAKKDKYLFKRREESKEVKPPQKEIEKEKVPSSPQLSHVDDSTAIAAGDFVLQKRAPATPPEQVLKPPIANDELPSKEDTPTPILPESGDPIPATTAKAESDATSPARETAPDGGHRKSGEDEKKIEEEKNITGMENGPKKVKVSKRPAGELSSGKVSPEKKKKRKKESLSSEATQTLKKDPIPSKKPVEEPHEQLELSRVLNDLHSLALDPFNAITKGIAVKTRHVFLKFRSVVFQKSLNSSPPPEENNAVKLPPVKTENTFSGRPDDPTKGGRKRGPSDRQEEMAAKKKKKVGDIKNLTKEKKLTKKSDYPPPAPAPAPTARDVKRGVPAPTVLIMRFPPGGSLPSIHELKAKFVHCGPMDKEGTRILWKSLQCRVVFRYHADAQAALKMAVRSGSLFGNNGVRCSLRAVADFQPPPPPKPKEYNHPPPPPAVQLKSCLKKSGEEGGGNGGRVAARARVKFVLDGDESHHKNKKNGDGDAGGSSSFSSSSSSDFNSKNFQKTSSLPLLPLPTSSGVGSSSNVQFTRPPLIPLAPPLIPLAPPLLPTPRSFNYGGDMAQLPPPRLPLPPPPPKYVHNLQRPNIGEKVDISQQMLRLMTKCNEVVANVRNMMGYVPYHPL